MNNKQIKDLILKELTTISEQQELKDFLNTHLSGEIAKYTETEDYERITPNQKQYIINSMVKLSLPYLLKLARKGIKNEYLAFIIEQLIESIFKVTIICIDAGFDKTERIKLQKEETSVSVKFGLSVLRDESKITEEEYSSFCKLFK